MPSLRLVCPRRLLFLLSATLGVLAALLGPVPTDAWARGHAGDEYWPQPMEPVGPGHAAPEEAPVRPRQRPEPEQEQGVAEQAPAAAEPAPADAAEQAVDAAQPGEDDNDASVAPDTADAPGAEAAGAPAEEDDETLASRHTPGQQPELTVVPIHNAAGRAFDQAVGRYVMEGLVNITHLTPLPATRAMIARLHPGPKELHLPTTLTTLGRRLHSPYVLVVEAVGQPHPTHVFMGLVETKSGLTLMVHRARLPHGRLTPELGLDLSARVRAALRHPAALRRAAQARQQGRANAVPEPPPEPTPAPAQDAAKDEAAQKKADKDEEAQEARRQRREADDELPRAMLDRGRGWFAIQLAQRISRLNVNNVDGVTAPCYCGTDKQSNPFFPFYAFGGEVFTGLFTKQRRRLQDNLGLRLNVALAPVRSYVQGASTTTIRSTVVQLEADALWRLLWLPHRSLSPDATIGVGVAYYAFPLKNAAYPGVAYVAPNLRLDLNFPVHRTVGLIAQVGLRPSMTPLGNAKTELGTAGKGLGLMFGVGARGHWSLFEAELKFRVESYAANFKGATTLPGTANGVTSGTPVQFQNAKLRDSLKEIILQVGVAY